MKVRLASLAFLLASVATGLTWLTLQPTLLRLTAAVAKRAGAGGPEQALLNRINTVLPYELALNLLLVGALTYGVLHLVVGRPLQGAEAILEQLEKLNLDLPISGTGGGGPLLARLQGSLVRTAHALKDAQQVTADQLEALTQANVQLRNAQAELVAAERLATVGRLAAGVAHEVGNPLSGILGYLSLARAQTQASGEGAREELVDFLRRIEEEVQRINGIVRSLLELGRPPRDHNGPVELSPLVDACVQLVRAGPDFSDVAIETRVPPGLMVMAEPGPLSQVLINLLLNAAQAMRSKGRIRVEASESSGDEACLVVLDEGTGISPEVMPRLFEPFFTTKQAGKGTGLGLAVSLHLALTMGGRLDARNRSEGGAAFALTLKQPPAQIRSAVQIGS